MNRDELEAVIRRQLQPLTIAGNAAANRDRIAAIMLAADAYADMQAEIAFADGYRGGRNDGAEHGPMQKQQREGTALAAETLRARGSAGGLL